MNKSGILFTFVLILLMSFGVAQGQNKGAFGLTISILNTHAKVQSAAQNHDFTTYKGNGFLGFSADYWYPINDWLDAETGVAYSLQNFTKTVSHRLDNSTLVPLHSSEDKDIHMVSIPLGVRAEFLKYLFVNGGMLVDLTHEPGIGSYFGLGAKIISEIGYGLYVNPYVRMHSILPIDFNPNADRIMEAGIKIGLVYSLDNKFSKR